jgi:hypothetical protein
LCKVIGKSIEELANTIKKNNLNDIIKFGLLNSFLMEYRTNAPTEMKAFIPIVEKIEQKTEPFRENDLGNVFAAVRWCVNHGMYQNAYSILLEGCISIALHTVGITKIATDAGDNRDIRQDVQDKREIVKFAALIRIKRKTEQDLADDKQQLKSLMIKIMSILPIDVAGYITKLSDYRNGYMHCGTGKEPVPGRVIEDLGSFLPNLEAWYCSIKGKINE